jgi:hypothetical protein
MNNTNIDGASVQVLTDSVHIKNLTVTGAPANRIIEGTLEGTDPIYSIMNMLEIGAIALGTIRTEEFTRQIESVAENFAKIVGREATVNFPKMIEEKTAQYVNAMNGYLDPKQVNSLRTQMETGLVKIKEDLANKLTEELKANKLVVEEALKGLGFLKKAVDQSTQKGISHQDYVGQALEKLCGSDLVTDLSADEGGKLYIEKKSKSGDFLVTLGETLNDAAPLSFVVEAKDSKLSEKIALQEILNNQRNRGTKVGILVFANQEQAPTQGKPLKIFPGNRIMVVADYGSETALYAAYAYARQLLKSLSSTNAIDSDRLNKNIEEILHHLDIENAINKDAKSIRNALDRLVSTSLNAKNSVIEILKQFDSVKGKQ